MTIGIIGAMDEEIAILLEHMQPKERITVANCEFFQGELYNKDIVLLKSNIGKVNASMATTILHERFHPEYVINTGSAGGFLNQLDVGDIVISDTVVQHDVDVTGFGYEYGQVPDMPSSFQANQRLVQQTESTMEKLDIRYRTGVIVTGDVFMNDPERIAFVKHAFPEMIAMEMEAGAIAQVCYQYETPFVVIRSLSDIAGKEATLSFDAFLHVASHNAANVIINLIRSFE